MLGNESMRSSRQQRRYNPPLYDEIYDSGVLFSYFPDDTIVVGQA